MAIRRAFSLIAFGASLLCSAAFADVFRVNDLAGGMNDSVPGNMIADNEAVSITNFHINTDSRGLDQRSGSFKQNITQLSGNTAVDTQSYTKTNGNSYLLSVASRTISYSIDNGSNWTTLITTATNGSVWDGVGFLDDNFYMVTQNDGGWYFTGSGFLPAGSMPSGKYIENYQNRLFVANTSTYPYRLFFSGLLQPTTWTTTTDYIDFPESITGIGEPVDGGLPVYTLNTTWMLRGTGPTNFYLTQISGKIGCADNRTIQNTIIDGQEYQVFLSLGPNGSRKNLYGLLGDALVPLGDKVENLIDSIAIFDTSNRIFQWDVQSEFAEGSVSGTYVSGTDAVKLSTASQLDSDAAHFTGTMVNVDTSAVSGRLTLSGVQNFSFEYGTTTDANDWTEGVNAFNIGRTSETSAQHNTYVMAGGTDSSCVIDQTVSAQTFRILNSENTTLASYSFTVTTSYQKFDFDASAYLGQSIKLSLNGNKSSSFGPSGCGIAPIFSIAVSDAFILKSSTISFYSKAYGTDNKKIAYDLILSVATGSYTSRTFDTTFSSAAWMPSSVSTAAFGNTLAFKTQSSVDGNTWTSTVSWNPGAGDSPSSAYNRYFRYVLEITTTSTGTDLPYLDSIELNARNSSGSYTSEVRDSGASNSAWNTFNANPTGDGTIAYFYRTSSTVAGIDGEAWSSIASGSDVAGSARHFQWKSDFSITNSTHDPTLERIIQNYTSSSGSLQPTDSVVWDDEYWLSFQDDDGDDEYNNKILVMNKEGNFSQFTGLNVYGFSVINRLLVGGDSINDGVNGGYVRQLDIGETDDGATVNASVTFKHNEFPELQDYRKLANQAYISYGVGVGTFTVTVLENFTEDTNTYSIRFATGTTVGRWKLELTPGTAFKQIGFKFDNSYPGSKLNIYPPLSIHFEKQKLIPEGGGSQ